MVENKEKPLPEFSNKTIVIRSPGCVEFTSELMQEMRRREAEEWADKVFLEMSKRSSKLRDLLQSYDN
jgi:hypothetical protein